MISLFSIWYTNCEMLFDELNKITLRKKKNTLQFPLLSKLNFSKQSWKFWRRGHNRCIHSHADLNFEIISCNLGLSFLFCKTSKMFSISRCLTGKNETMYPNIEHFISFFVQMPECFLSHFAWRIWSMGFPCKITSYSWNVHRRNTISLVVINKVMLSWKSYKHWFLNSRFVFIRGFVWRSDRKSQVTTKLYFLTCGVT